MFHKVKSVYPIENYYLIVIFSEGVIKKYDVKPIFDEIKIFNDLKNNNLFEQVTVGPGGYGIIWNDDIDLACDELFENGVQIKTVFDDLLSINDASILWNLDESTLRKAIKKGKLIQGIDVNKYGKQWVITIQSMIKNYGPRKV